jgi:hypothetical protein
MIFVNVVYSAFFYYGQPEEPIRLEEGPSHVNEPYTDETSSDEALARALQAEDPNWSV